MSYMSEAIKGAKDAAFEANKRLNEYTDSIHKQSTDDIGANAGGVDELAGLVSDLLEKVDAIDKRVAALEGGKA